MVVGVDGVVVVVAEVDDVVVVEAGVVTGLDVIGVGLVDPETTRLNRKPETILTLDTEAVLDGEAVGRAVGEAEGGAVGGTVGRLVTGAGAADVEPTEGKDWVVLNMAADGATLPWLAGTRP